MIYKVEALKKRLKGGEFDPVYLLGGEEEYPKEEVIQILEKTFIHPAWASFDRILYFGGETPVGDVIQSLLTPPVASKRKIVILKDLQKLSEGERREILQYVKNPNQDSCLLLVAVVSNFQEGFYSQVSKHASSTIFYKPFEWELEKWVKETLSRKGYSMDEKALQLFLGFTETHLGNLSNELEKLLTYLGERKRITLEDLSRVLGHSKKRDIFQVTKAIGEKDEKEGMIALENLLLWNERPTVILAMIARHFFLLLKLKDLLDMKIGRSEMSSRLGIKEFFLKEYLEGASKTSRKDLLRGLEEVYRLERRIKSGLERGVFGFESLILKQRKL